ncbi:hypothetical protein M1466_02960, partial [Candidatus Dependentiae bacterium]|nr:hypothetical protein [Candidatus Dependentiae bacterium]
MTQKCMGALLLLNVCAAFAMGDAPKREAVHGVALSGLAAGADRNKAYDDVPDAFYKTFCLWPLAWGSSTAKSAKTWRQIGKHAAAASVCSVFWGVGHSFYKKRAFQQSLTEQHDNAPVAPDFYALGQREASLFIRLYFTGMMVAYTHNAIFNFVDKGEKPAWMKQAWAYMQKNQEL